MPGLPRHHPKDPKAITAEGSRVPAASQVLSRSVSEASSSDDSTPSPHLSARCMRSPWLLLVLALRKSHAAAGRCVTTASGTTTYSSLVRRRLLPFRGVNVVQVNTMSQSTSETHSRYEEAVRRLNSLQSNAMTLTKLKERRDVLREQNVPETLDCMGRAGIQLEQLSSLRAIHVTGTKGKGSTCAYVDSLLRSLGLRTGFFSSPHMVSVRERVRVDGKPLSEEAFADRLFSLYDRLVENPASPDFPAMPAYFKFLTLLAFDVFLEEKVDVAIIEVGIGGEFDCTNVLISPVVTAISTLDIDHTALLGNTISQIAWNKAGIFKRDSTAVVSEDMTEDALGVIRERAEEKKVRSLSVCPSYSAYKFVIGGEREAAQNGDGKESSHLASGDGPSPSSQTSAFCPGIAGEHQKTNVSLALQATRAWLKRERPILESKLFGNDSAAWQPGAAFEVHAPLSVAIANCHWPGRSQVLKMGRRRFFLDGAHTSKSMQNCVRWFVDASGPAKAKVALENGDAIRKTNGVDTQDTRRRKHVLLFHCTGDRQPQLLMDPLTALPFWRVLLTPPAVHSVPAPSSDSANFFSPYEEQRQQSSRCEEAWRRLRPEMEETAIRRFDCVTEALADIDEMVSSELDESEEVDILVTGSLILVGNLLSVIHPDIDQR